MEIKPTEYREDARDSEGDRFYSVVDESGILRCFCGRELIKMDETTYKCTGGFPIYRFEDGSLLIDKFGNLMIKEEEHE